MVRIFVDQTLFGQNQFEADQPGEKQILPRRCRKPDGIMFMTRPATTSLFWYWSVKVKKYQKILFHLQILQKPNKFLPQPLMKGRIKKVNALYYGKQPLIRSVLLTIFISFIQGQKFEYFFVNFLKYLKTRKKSSEIS